MTPEQLIVELEAALHQGEGHDWRLLAPLVLDVLKSMQAAHERLTAERDVAREFYGEWRGIADQRQSDLDELRADAWAMICDATNDQNAAAENRARRDRDFREANRLVEDLRAELAKAGESIRAYERMIDDVAEKASALACEEVKAEFLRRDTIARLQAAEIEALKNELARLTTPRPGEPLELDCGDNSCLFAKTRGGMRTNGGCRCLENLGFHRSERESIRRMAAEVVSLRKWVLDLTTPRPIEEAPKDGTWILGFMPGSIRPVAMSYLQHEWRRSFKQLDGEGLHPTEFLPLPVKP